MEFSKQEYWGGLQYNPAIALLDIYLNELKTYIHTKTSKKNVDSTFGHNCQTLEAT